MCHRLNIYYLYMDSRTLHSDVVPLQQDRYPNPHHCSCLMQYSLEEKHIMVLGNYCTYEVILCSGLNRQKQRNKTKKKQMEKEFGTRTKSLTLLLLFLSEHVGSVAYITDTILSRKRIKIPRFWPKKLPKTSNIFPWRFRQYSSHQYQCTNTRANFYDLFLLPRNSSCFLDDLPKT